MLQVDRRELAKLLSPDVDCASIEDDFLRRVALTARAGYRMTRGHEDAAKLHMVDVEYESVSDINC